MRCPNCSTENPDQAKFCFNCGQSFAQERCTNCGSELPPNARFCMNCGQPVAGKTQTEEARHTRLAQSAPAPIKNKMRAAHLAGERKLVTVLFADVVGSTALAEHLDPEDWTAIMNRAYDVLSPSVYMFEGTIARLMGDALLAFFGAPIVHEDDPLRAVRGALHMLDAARDYAAEVKAQHKIDFQIRVGINTGLVIVGEVGSDLKYEYTAMGDAVNLAARLQSAARPMTVLISEQTYRYIAPAIDVTDLGSIEVKGKSEPVHVFEVTGIKAQPGRLRGVAGLESPMVGRDAELRTLVELSRGLKQNSGHVVAVIGEPGLGKTRLISEWKAAVSESNGQSPSSGPHWAEGHCLSYGQGLAYHLLTDMLRSLLGVSAAANENEVRASLQSLSRELFADDQMDVYPYLAHLLSLHLEGAAQERVQSLDPQALQTQYLSSLRALLQALSAREPLTLILDDVHWADPSSTELLIKLQPLTSESPILFAFVTRPDRDAPGWKLITNARETLGTRLTELDLNPLSDEDSRQLVANLLEIEALPDHIRTIILQKAEGNPFFVEEVIRMLIDRGAILKKGEGWIAGNEIDTIEIPDNLQGLLLARIDRMPEDVKRTLRVASVIGRQFSVRVLEQVLAQA